MFNESESESTGKTRADQLPGPVVPLSPTSLLRLSQVRQVLQDPARRPPRPSLPALPSPVAEALRILDDGAFRAASAALHPAGGGKRPDPAEARTLRRALLGTLRARYPEALAAIRAGKARPSGGASPIFLVNVIAGVGSGPALDDADSAS